MRKAAFHIFGFLALLVGAAIPAWGQCSSYTTITGTVIDPHLIPYQTAFVTADLFPPGVNSPTCTPASGGTRLQFSTHIGPTQLDINGSFTLQVPTSSVITPTTQWTFTIGIAPAVILPWGTGPQSFTYTVTVTGSSMDLSVPLTALAPALTKPFCAPGSSTAGCFGGVGSCILTGLLDTNVLFIHPNATCDATPKFTWDVTKENLQAGDGTNTIGAVATITDTYGSGNTVCSSTNPTTCSEVYASGSGNDVESSGANLHDVFTEIGVSGQGNFVVGNISNTYVIGGGPTFGNRNAIFSDASSTIKDSLCFMSACSLNSENGATVSIVDLTGDSNTFNGAGASAVGQDIFLTGFLNSGEADDTSIVSSLFKYGEGLLATASGASTLQDYYGLGNSSTTLGDTTVTAAGASAARFLIDVGFSNAYASSAGHSFKRVYGFGELDSFSASSADVQDMYGIGDNLTEANCSHCLALGESISLSASNVLRIGMDAAGELDVTPGAVALNYASTLSPLCTNGSKVITTAGCAAMSGTVNAALQFSAPYYSGAGSTNVISGISPPTTFGVWTEVWNTGTGGAVVPTFTLAGVPVNSISSASPTVIGDATGTDRATLLRTTNNTTSTAVTVPSPFGSNFPFVHCNAGTVTATDTPSSSTVNGNSTLVLQPQPSGGNPECALWWSDNSNWFSAEIVPTDANGSVAASAIPSNVPITSLTLPYNNQSPTGTTLNKIVKIVSDPPVAEIITTSDNNASFGIAHSGAGTTGIVQVAVIGQQGCVFDGATTALDYVVASTTTAGDCHDSGSGVTFPTGVVVLGTVLSTNGSGGTYTVNLFTPDTASATSGPNGKGTTIQANGTNTKSIVNLNSTTPAAPAGDQNCTPQSSNSGNTTSESCYISSLFGANIVDGLAPVTITTGTSATLGSTYKSGYTVNQEATAAAGVAYTLPPAAAGLQYCINNGYNGSAADTGVLTLNTSASGQFIFNLATGTLTASGGNLTSGGAAGDSLCVRGDDSTHWTAFAQFGTWTVH